MALELVGDSGAASLKCVICHDKPLHPLLLTCQHYICNSCAVQVKGSFKCPTCHVRTECSTAPVDILCPALLQGSLARQSLHCSGPSGDWEKSATSAVSWCTDCQRSLCNVCDSEHQRENRSHNILAMDGLTRSQELYRQPPRTCTDDKAELSLACFTCDEAKCFNCAHSCYSSSHHILPFLHADFSEHLANFKTDISGLLWAVNSSVVRLDSHLIFLQRVTEAEERDIRVLEDSKKAAIESINRAYDNAKQSLLSCYDSVKTKAHTIYKGAQAIKTRVQMTNKHWDNALKSDDNLSVFTQLSALKASVHKLVKSLSHAVDPIDADSVVQSGVSLPDDLDRITSEWLGQAKILKDDFVYLESETPSQAECEYMSKKAVQELPKFGAAYATINLPFFCYDVSVTDDGHLLLADCNGHLLEYTTSGQELNRWRPPKDQVVSVETLSDGRVAVGLRYAKVVVLLKRVSGAAGDEAWLENERLDQLQVTPMSLSAYENGLAVANICNSNVEVICLSQRRQRSNNERTYHVKSVAITDKLVITVSFSFLEPSLSKRSHVVEAYTREGDEDQLMWRHELPGGEQARDVCVDATCHVVYFIAGKTNTTKGRVTAVSALDGTVLRNDVISFDGHFFPHKLSLSKTAKDAILAVLTYESTTDLSSTLSVYRGTLAETDVNSAKTEVTRL